MIKITSLEIGDIQKLTDKTKLDTLYKEKITKMIQANDLVLFGALDAKKLIGRVSLWLAPADEDLLRELLPGVPIVNALQIHENYRKRGVGTALMAALEDKAKKLGHNKLALGVESDNSAAIRLYEKLGYAMTGDTYESCWDEEQAGVKKQVCVTAQLMTKEIR